MSGTAHVGVRREGANVWPTPGRNWECYDRGTGARIGPLHPTRWEAQHYAEMREATTYSTTPDCDQHGAACGRVGHL